MTRPSWDDYFLEMAHSVSTRSTCNRKQVGCVLVRDNQLLSSGYGGSIKGQPHCMDEGCAIDEATGHPDLANDRAALAEIRALSRRKKWWQVWR